MRNLVLKLASLLCAILLSMFVNYFMVASDQGDRVVQLIAPVEVRNLPAEKALIWPENKQVEITIQGSSLFMSKVTLSPPVVKINLPEQIGKKYVARLSAADITLPATVRLLGMKPSELEFEIDDIVEKKLRVVVPQIGELAEELKLARVSIEPAEIKIKGPARELAAVLQIETTPLNLSSLTDTAEIDLDLRNPGIMSELEIKKVKARAEVKEAIGEISLQNLPLRVDIADQLLKDKAISVSPKTVGVRIKATKKILRNFNKDGLIPYITLDNQGQIGSYLDVKIDMNNTAEDLQIIPNRVLVSMVPVNSAAASKESTQNSVSKKSKKN